jgi:hypothetical protein
VYIGIQPNQRPSIVRFSGNNRLPIIKNHQFLELKEGWWRQVEAD